MVDSTEITPDLERIKTLIGKVKNLADKGVDGEKQVAQNKLEKLLKKYGLNLSDIGDDENKQHRLFRIKNREDYVAILAQIIWDVVPNVSIKQDLKKLQIYCKLTTEQYIEVKERFDYFWNLWGKEKEQFMLAFIIKNRLGINQNKDAKPMDEEKLNGIREKMSGVKKGEYINKNAKLITK